MDIKDVLEDDELFFQFAYDINLLVFGNSVEECTQKVKDLTDMIAQIRGRMGSAATAAIGGDGDVLGALSSPSGAMNLDEDTRKAIRNIIRAANNSNNSTLNELGDALGTLTSGGAASALERSIQEEIRAKKGDRPARNQNKQPR